MKPHLAAGQERFPASLSVFFPAYNDAPSLPSLVHSAFEVLERHVEDFEVIVVNDGSTDDTQAVAESLQNQYGSRMRVIRHEANRGYGGALQTGFRAATGSYVFYTDGDGQYDVRDLPKLLAAARPGVGLVNGYKIRRQDPLHRILIGTIYNRFVRLLFHVALRDVDCDFRLVKRSVMEGVQLSSTSGTICIELVKCLERNGTLVQEVPVHHYPRRHGRSQFFRIGPLLSTFRQLLALWMQLMLPGLRKTDSGQRR